MQTWLTANAVVNGDIHPQGDIDLTNSDVSQLQYTSIILWLEKYSTPNLNQKSLGFLECGAPRSGERPSEFEDRDSLGVQRNLTADTADFNGYPIQSRR